MPFNASRAAYEEINEHELLLRKAHSKITLKSELKAILLKPSVHYRVLFSSMISEPFWYVLRTIKITLSVICVIRIMWATHADTCINALKNIRDLPSRNMSEINTTWEGPK